MDLQGIQENLDELGFEKAKQKAVLNLIDVKINNDMKEVISEIKRLEDKQDTKFSMLMWAMGILIALILALKFIR